MDKNKIEMLVNQLRAELTALPEDEKTTELLAQLDAELQALLGRSGNSESMTDTSAESEPLTDTAKRLEAHFAAKHPVAESSLREIIDALVRMGV